MAEIKEIEIKDIVFDIRTVGKSRIAGQFRSNRTFAMNERDRPLARTPANETIFDVYHMEIYIPPTLPVRNGRFLLRAGGLAYTNDLKTRGSFVMVLPSIIEKGTKLSAELEYESAEGLGHYTFQLRLENR